MPKAASRPRQPSIAGIWRLPWCPRVRGVAAWPARAARWRPWRSQVLSIPDGTMPPCGTRSTFPTSGSSRHPRSSPRWPAGRRRSGRPVTYRGNQITIDDVVFLPTPVQRPRVPIWVGGVWPNKAPIRRAARWDGAIPAMAGGIESARPPAVREVRELVGFLRGCRAQNGLADKPFDIIVGGTSPAGPAAGHDLVGPLADLGITWWDERMPWGDDLERTEPILRRIEQGPPRL
jgi:hypothetical protein